MIQKSVDESNPNEEAAAKIIDDMVDWTAEVALFVETIQPVLEETFRFFAEIAFAQVAYTDPTYDPIDQAAKAWIQQHSFDLVTGINDTTKTRLRERLLEYWSEGYSSDDLAAMVRTIFEEATKYRSYMIARTETSFAANMGTVSAYQRAGINGKRWLTGSDERVCSKCGPMHGKKAPIDQPFENGFLVPPAHPNCRCTIVSDLIRASDIISTRNTYTDSYKEKLIDMCKYFENEGIDVSEHAANQLVGRIHQNRISSKEMVLETFRNGKTYIEGNGNLVKYGNGMSIHFNDKTKQIVTVSPRKKPAADWRE